MEEMICVDSDVIIDFLKGRTDAVDIFAKHQGQLFATEINIFEVFDGIYSRKEINKREVDFANAFFETIPVFFSKPGWGCKSAQLLSALMKKGKEIEEKDCFILGIMAVHGCNKIITRNVKHYSAVPGIQVITY